MVDWLAGGGTAIVATGADFADSLAGGQHAAQYKDDRTNATLPRKGFMPSMVLLADSVKDPTVETLVDMSSDAFVENKTTVVGGPSAFGDDLATAINDLIEEELDYAAARWRKLQ